MSAALHVLIMLLCCSARRSRVAASFRSQPIEVPELRTLLFRRAQLELLLRMGYGQKMAPTPVRLFASAFVLGSPGGRPPGKDGNYHIDRKPGEPPRREGEQHQGDG